MREHRVEAPALVPWMSLRRHAHPSYAQVACSGHALHAPPSARPPSRWRPAAESAGPALRPRPFIQRNRRPVRRTTESRGRAPLQRRRRSPADGHCAKVAAQDAVHVVLAVVNGVDYLVTWNLRHITNAVVRPGIERICQQAGFEATVICTPDELMEDYDATGL